MQDGLHGRCQLRPVGTQVRPGVWCAPAAEIDPTVAIQGPAFIGARTKIAGGSRISDTSSIERDCEIDCGTVIANSLVLRGTYIGVALDVRRSVVAHAKICNLDRNVEVSVPDARLIGRSKQPAAPWAGLTALLRSEAAGD
jgi:NDP-sugar pyrophosphorylase family protein